MSQSRLSSAKPMARVEQLSKSSVGRSKSTLSLKMAAPLNEILAKTDLK